MLLTSMMLRSQSKFQRRYMTILKKGKKQIINLKRAKKVKAKEKRKSERKKMQI